VLPAVLALLFLAGGLLTGLALGPLAAERLGPDPARVSVGGLAIATFLLRLATVAAGMTLGFGLALALTAPVIEQISRRVEAKAAGQILDRGLGVRSELREAARAAAYFLAMAALAFAIGLVPFAGPVLAALWAAYALSFQLTDPPLARRGLSFREKRAWHRTHRAESEGFGLAGLVLLLVPFANLLLGPAMAAGGALLVLRVESDSRH
jgi:CysZ protein